MPRRTPLDRVRKLCLDLPETAEKEAWGRPTFRVAKKVFVMFADNHHDDRRLALWCAAAPGGQDVLVGADAERFFVPPYVGVRGWIGVRLDIRPDWNEVEAIVEDAYRFIAPKRLAATLGEM